MKTVTLDYSEFEEMKSELKDLRESKLCRLQLITYIDSLKAQQIFYRVDSTEELKVRIDELMDPFIKEQVFNLSEENDKLKRENNALKNKKWFWV